MSYPHKTATELMGEGYRNDPVITNTGHRHSEIAALAHQGAHDHAYHSTLAAHHANNGHRAMHKSIQATDPKVKKHHKAVADAHYAKRDRHVRIAAFSRSSHSQHTATVHAFTGGVGTLKGSKAHAKRGAAKARKEIRAGKHN